MSVASAAVCFDMDGVLVDSERHWACRERNEIFPATVDDRVDPGEIAGMNIEDLYGYLDREYGTIASRDEFLDRYNAAACEVYREESTLLSGARELIADLRRKRRVALVSSSPVRWIDHVLDRFDLAFDAVVSADHVERGKPDPDVYERAAADLEVNPTDCVAVEDSAHGLAAATAAGMETVGFSRRGDPPLEADRTVSDASELREVLRASGFRRR